MKRGNKKMVEDKKIFKKIEQEGNFWNPTEENEEIRGTITEIQDIDYGRQYKIKQDDGVIITTPSHKVLQNRMRDMKLGDYVKIVFTHEELPTVKGNNPTKFYDVYKAE